MGADNNCERNKIDDELTRMSNFVRFLVRIYFLPLKLEENQSKATFSLCSLPAILNFLFYYVSSVSLCCINQVLYYSSLQEEWDAVIDSISFVDILSSTSFHSLILLLFPGLPLLLGRVIIKNNQILHMPCLDVNISFRQLQTPPVFHSAPTYLCRRMQQGWFFSLSCSALNLTDCCGNLLVSRIIICCGLSTFSYLGVFSTPLYFMRDSPAFIPYTMIWQVVRVTPALFPKTYHFSACLLFFTLVSSIPFVNSSLLPGSSVSDA